MYSKVNIKSYQQVKDMEIKLQIPPRLKFDSTKSDKIKIHYQLKVYFSFPYDYHSNDFNIEYPLLIYRRVESLTSVAKNLQKRSTWAFNNINVYAISFLPYSSHLYSQLLKNGTKVAPIIDKNIDQENEQLII